MSKNNLILFPTPKKDKGSKKAVSASQGEGSVISWTEAKKNHIQARDKSSQSNQKKQKKPSYNPYKAWVKAQNKEKAKLIDGTNHWPAVPPHKGRDHTPKEKPYTFAGTGLSFLLVAGALLFGQGNKNQKDRDIASPEHYKPPMKIIKNGQAHQVTLYKNEYGNVAIRLTSKGLNQTSRDLDSLLSSQTQKDSETVGNPTNGAKKLERKPNNLPENAKNLKQVWRDQEQQALYLIKTGQRKIISIGRKPY